MLTKDKLVLLNGFTEVIARKLPPANACLGASLAGVVVADLPNNHDIFKLSLTRQIIVLKELVDDCVDKGIEKFI